MMAANMPGMFLQLDYSCIFFKFFGDDLYVLMLSSRVFLGRQSKIMHGNSHGEAISLEKVIRSRTKSRISSDLQC